MSSTAILRTPPAPTSRRNEYLSLRPARGLVKENDRDTSLTPVPLFSKSKAQASKEYLAVSCSSRVSPSPLRKRALFQQNASDCSDSEDEEMSPSLDRSRSSPFSSRCASQFLGGWGGGRVAKHPMRPIEDDEGLFLVNGTSSSHQSSAKIVAATPAPKKRPSLATLSSLPQSRPRVPQTPAETEWHLGRQAESMTKLSLGDDEEEPLPNNKFKQRLAAASKAPESSPSVYRHSRKRSFEGNEIPRTKGFIFETVQDTPVAPSFHFPDTPPSMRKVACSPTLFFGPSIHPTPVAVANANHLAVPSVASSEDVRCRSVSPKSSSERIAKKYKPRDSGVAGLEKDEDISVIVVNPALLHQRDEEDTEGLITPCFEPPPRAAWPAPEEPKKVDEFIFKTLVAGGAAPKDKKGMPDTPVKRNAYMPVRPWMSTSKAVPSPEVARGGGKSTCLPMRWLILILVYSPAKVTSTDVIQPLASPRLARL